MFEGKIQILFFWFFWCRSLWWLLISWWLRPIMTGDAAFLLCFLDISRRKNGSTGIFYLVSGIYRLLCGSSRQETTTHRQKIMIPLGKSSSPVQRSSHGINFQHRVVFMFDEISLICLGLSLWFLVGCEIQLHHFLLRTELSLDTGQIFRYHNKVLCKHMGGYCVRIVGLANGDFLPIWQYYICSSLSLRCLATVPRRRWTRSQEDLHIIYTYPSACLWPPLCYLLYLIECLCTINSCCTVLFGVKKSLCSLYRHLLSDYV